MLLNFKHFMGSSILIYKEIRILKLEHVVLQSNCLFVYDQLQKSLSTTFDNCFHKTTDHHSHDSRGEKLKLPITKTSIYDLQSITSSSISDSNNLNNKAKIDLDSPELTRTKFIKGIRQDCFSKY